MGKAHVLGLQSTLEFGPRSPAVPHPKCHPMDTNLRSIGAGCMGRVVIATLPNSCAKGYGRAAGELEDRAAAGKRDAGGTGARPARSTVSTRDGAGAGLFRGAAERTLLCEATCL